MGKSEFSCSCKLDCGRARELVTICDISDRKKGKPMELSWVYHK